MNKQRAPRNRTIALSEPEKLDFSRDLACITKPVDMESIENVILNQDIFELISFLPNNFVDLLILDPPYNLNKNFQSVKFKKKSIEHYAQWFENWFTQLLPKLSKTGS